jgi:serine/threonine protein kinase
MRTFTLCGTPEYLAPEILMNQGMGNRWISELSAYSYEMIAGIDPFADHDPLVINQNILKRRLRFPKEFHSDANSLVKQ